MIQVAASNRGERTERERDLMSSTIAAFPSE